MNQERYGRPNDRGPIEKRRSTSLRYHPVAVEITMADLTGSTADATMHEPLTRDCPRGVTAGGAGGSSPRRHESGPEWTILEPVSRMTTKGRWRGVLGGRPPAEVTVALSGQSRNS